MLSSYYEKKGLCLWNTLIPNGDCSSHLTNFVTRIFLVLRLYLDFTLFYTVGSI